MIIQDSYIHAGFPYKKIPNMWKECYKCVFIVNPKHLWLDPNVVPISALLLCVNKYDKEKVDLMNQSSLCIHIYLIKHLKGYEFFFSITDAVLRQHRYFLIQQTDTLSQSAIWKMLESSIFMTRLNTSYVFPHINPILW